jgi:hypothetical protein
MKEHFMPVQEDFFSSPFNDVMPVIPDSPFHFSGATPADRNLYASMLELRVFRATKIPIHHAVGQWIAREILSSIGSNTAPRANQVVEAEEQDRSSVSIVCVCLRGLYYCF